VILQQFPSPIIERAARTRGRRHGDPAGGPRQRRHAARHGV